MFRTLFAKLSAVLFLLFAAIGSVALYLGLYSAQMYQQEVAQRLNLDLSQHIADEYMPSKGLDTPSENLEHLFHSLMVINPSVELYLLDAGGAIMDFSAAPGAVQRSHVSLGPINTLLANPEQLPVLGDDPRNASRKKAFSVAPLFRNGLRQGYIYAIVGSEQADDVADLLTQSYILRWSAGALAAGILFATTAGLLIMFFLTRRLRKIGRAMDDFRSSDFSDPVNIKPANDAPVDEIEKMEANFAGMAERIRNQMGSLREADRMRRELFANVSHDLRTPLASLVGYLETLIIKDKNISHEQRRTYLATAHRNTERLSKLILELFELAKLDARELKPEPEAFSPAELVQDVALKFRIRARKKGIKLHAGITPNASFVNADIGMIERVLNNLLDNALRHTPPGGSIRLSVQSNDQNCRIKVADTGRGISERDLPHVFKRFYRSTDRAKDDSGCGLGLAIAHRIVELHGGRISIDSKLNSGSVFVLDLPSDHFSAT